METVSEQKSGNKADTKKILIVDDDRVIRHYLKNLSDGLGFTALLASSGKEALEVFDKEKPGVVLLDYRLPDMTGRSVLSEIKKIYPPAQVIIITGHGKYDVAVSLINGGAADYLKKPVEDSVLAESIAKAYDTYSRLTSGIGMLNIVVADKNPDIASYIEQGKPHEGWNIVHSAEIKEAETQVKSMPADIVIMDIDFCGSGHGLECLKKLKKLPLSCEVIITAEKGNEGSAIEALKSGAAGFIRKPDDISEIFDLIEDTRRDLNLKRVFKLKVEELRNTKEITAKITDLRKIELSMFTPDSHITSSFALRFLDNIPVGIAVLGEDMDIIYCNRFFQKSCGGRPGKLGSEVISSLRRSGINDVTIEVIAVEAAKLFSQEEDIETVILGKQEYLTLTTIRIVDEKGPRTALLFIQRCS